MERIKVAWCDKDLEVEMKNMGIEPTKANIDVLKESRLIRNMEDAMTEAGWTAMRETIRIVLL